MKLTQAAVIAALFATTQTLHVKNDKTPVEVNEMVLQEDHPDYEPGLIQVEEVHAIDVLDDSEDALMALDEDIDEEEAEPDFLEMLDANDEAELAEEANEDQLLDSKGKCKCKYGTLDHKKWTKKQKKSVKRFWHWHMKHRKGVSWWALRRKLILFFYHNGWCQPTVHQIKAVKQWFNTIDTSHGNFISRKEWKKYLCKERKHSHKKWYKKHCK